MERMTPAKAMYMLGKVMEDRELSELPIAQLAYHYVNMHRDPGDPDKGIPAASPRPFHEFQFFRSSRDLATKDFGVPGPDGPQNYMGAVADRYSFETWGGARTPELWNPN